MDLGFTRLDAASADPAAVPLDYWRLVAGLAAMQAAGRTAMAQSRLADDGFAGTSAIAALVELYVAGPYWAAAAARLENSFHPETAVKAEGTEP